MEQRCRRVARVLAVVVVACTALHVVLAPLHDSGLVHAAAMVLLAAACLPCARHLYVASAPTPSTWLVVAGAAAAMLALHWVGGHAGRHPVGDIPGEVAGHAHHGVTPAVSGSTQMAELVMYSATALAASEVILALAGLAMTVAVLRRSARVLPAMHPAPSGGDLP
jgi:hypothetical protein